MKVKLTKLFHPNISKLTTENGGRGTHFAKFLISLFQWGLTHSALVIFKFLIKLCLQIIFRSWPNTASHFPCHWCSLPCLRNQQEVDARKSSLKLANILLVSSLPVHGACQLCNSGKKLLLKLCYQPCCNAIPVPKLTYH